MTVAQPHPAEWFHRLTATAVLAAIPVFLLLSYAIVREHSANAKQLEHIQQLHISLDSDMKLISQHLRTYVLPLLPLDGRLEHVEEGLKEVEKRLAECQITVARLTAK